MQLALSLMSALTILGCSSDQMAVQRSPDGRLGLKPSFHDGTLIRLTVRERSSGRLIDDVRTRDTDAMKWVTGWIDNSSYLFWGSDTGTSWVRKLDGGTVTELPLEGAACTHLEELFERKYKERRDNCLKYKSAK